MPRRRTLSALASVLLCLGSLAALAQTPAPRLHGPLREDARTTLPGSRLDVTLQGDDLGPVSPDEPLHGITLVFSRSPAQQAELDQLLAAQQDPASPQFHQWLTPERFGDRFGLAKADLDRTADWLRDEGFTVTGTSRARDRLVVSGTAATVEHAFGPALHRFRNAAGNLHIAPTAPVTLPSGLASITAAVLHLSTVRPVALSRIAPQPAYTASKTGAHYLTPADLSTMYDLPVQSGNTSVSVGNGQTIAIAGQSFVNVTFTSNIRNFLESTYTRDLSAVLIPGTGTKAISPADTLESELDIEYAGGVAPFSRVVLVYVGSDPSYNVFDSLTFAIDQNIAPVVSLSYGVCEALLSTTEINSSNSLYQQAAAQGQTLVVASGDTGSLACAPYTPSGQFTAAQQAALAVNFPASSPFFTAVGGTQIADASFSSADTADWLPSNPNGIDRYSSLNSWVPEVAWNESSVANGLFASAGGASAVFARPAWQTGLSGIPPGTNRLLPDIALQASSSHPGFLFCSNLPQFGDGCPYNTLYSGPNYPLVGGTSIAAPTFAAMVAVLNQDTQSLGQGNVNPILYRLAAQPAAAVFHDITTGTTACPAGTSGCSAAGQSTYSAGAGYDLATGLGSIDYLHLRSAWPTSGNAPFSTSLSLQPSFISPAAGSTGTVTINVGAIATSSANPPSPTGTVTLTFDGAQVAVLSLTTAPFGSPSQATYTVTTPPSAGSHLLAATYSGDNMHGRSYAVIDIPVGDSLATGSITLTAPAVTLPSNSSVTSTIGIVPAGGYTGRLTWTLALSNPSSASTTALCYGVTSPLVQSSTTASLYLGSGTACSSTSGHLTAPVVVSQATPLCVPWAGASASAAILLCLLPLARRRRIPPLLALCVACVLLPALSGCGSGSSPSSNPVSTPAPATTYTATLTALDSVNNYIGNSTTFTLTVR